MTHTDLMYRVGEAAQTGGLLAFESHVDALEAALASAPEGYAAAAEGDADAVYVLIEDAGEAMVAMAAASSVLEDTDDERSVKAVQNPYPTIAFMLGSYYVEVGRIDDAVRVLDAGIALPDMFGTRTSVANLMNERAAALNKAERFSEALEGYEAVLERSGIADWQRAAALRGRGFVHIELGQLDDAEQSYQESLVHEPDNAIALNELEYIAHLRAGGETVAGQTVMPNNQ